MTHYVQMTRSIIPIAKNPSKRQNKKPIKKTERIGLIAVINCRLPSRWGKLYALSPLSRKKIFLFPNKLTKKYTINGAPKNPIVEYNK